VLIRVEVQTTREAAFPACMYGYNTRIADRYNRTVVSLLMLADEDPDWRKELPPPLQPDFLREVDEYVEGQTMPYVTSFEREAMFELIEDLLRAKFGDEVAELLPAIHELNDAEKYKALNRVIASATTLDEVRRACVAAGAAVPRRKKGGNGKRGSKT
jgi:hypothetical protein